MTTTPLRPIRRPTPPTPAPPGEGPLRAGLPAALWALGAGCAGLGLPVLLVWAGDPRSDGDAAAALRAAGLVWLAAHGVPTQLGAGRLALLPLGLLLVPLLLLVRAGGTAARAHRPGGLRDAGLVAAAVAGPYALVAGMLAALASGGAARVSPASAVLATSVVALVGAGAGVLRSSRLDRELLEAVPAPLRRLLLPAVVAVLVLLAAGAVLSGVRLALAAGRAADLARAGAPGVVGGLALLVVGLALVPNAVVWSAGWWAGPGFAVGSGTVVGPFAHTLGTVPALPMLAALPATPTPTWLAVLAPTVPLLAGALAGALVARGPSPRPLVDGALCGPVAGVLFAGLVLLASGSAGAGRMADVGGSWWRSGLALAAAVAVGAAPTAWALRWWRVRAERA